MCFQVLLKLKCVRISSTSPTVNYSVLFAKASSRKNKIWEEDGFLSIKGKDLVLKVKVLVQ